MGFEHMAANFRKIFTHDQTDQDQYAMNFEPIPEPVSPWKVIMGDSLRDRALTQEISESFNPRYPGPSDLYPLADAGGRWFSEPNENADGERQSSIWLDPQIWQPTLSEFEKLADYFNYDGISFLVNMHSSESHPAIDHEGYITVTPVLLDRHGFGKSGDISFGITSDGRVNVGSVKTGFRDLGYLNPRRKNRQAVSDLMDVLNEPWEDDSR